MKKASFLEAEAECDLIMVMICPNCQYQMVAAKPGFMCLGCGNLVVKKLVKSLHGATTAHKAMAKSAKRLSAAVKKSH